LHYCIIQRWISELKGTVKRWLLGRGYGFIKPDDDENEVFVHHSELTNAQELQEGQKVEFEVQATDRGPRAVKVTVVE
jgi:CspA family cold shock protein